MKLTTKLTVLLTVLCLNIAAQIPAYYSDVNLALTGQSLQNELSQKIISTHVNDLSYTPEVWQALRITDLDPNNNDNVILIYGYDDTDGVYSTDRTRNKFSNGSGISVWNREHVYSKSRGTPNLGTSGAGADAHNLRPSDSQRNSLRSNRKFAEGTGFSGVTSNGDWYPGEEFKGDVARMIFYMYLRYGNRCLPTNIGVGEINTTDPNMVNIFLEWNASDPVSALELQRNPVLEELQGNRNPFIDNPSFATTIWGGPQAEDLFEDQTENVLCENIISEFPYGEGFENNLTLWIQEDDDDFDWTRHSGSTTSIGTGPTQAAEGSYYYYMESSTPNYSTKNAILESSCIDLTNQTQASFSFSYHMRGASNMGSLSLEVLENNTWTSIWSASGNQGVSWLTEEINLATYLGEIVKFRFNGTTGTTWKGDMAIDQLSFNIEDTNTEPDDNATLTELNITFDDYPEETSWLITDDNDNIVFFGENYGAQTSGSTLTIALPLEDGCYSLQFFDSYGDGMCCAYGNGSFSLLNVNNGAILAEGGTFSSTDILSFCVETAPFIGSRFQDSELTGIHNVQSEKLVIYPNPTSDKLFVSAIENFQYHIISPTGQTVKTGFSTDQIEVDDIANGAYILKVFNDTKIMNVTFVKK